MSGNTKIDVIEAHNLTLQNYKHSTNIAQLVICKRRKKTNRIREKEKERVGKIGYFQDLKGCTLSIGVGSSESLPSLPFLSANNRAGECYY